jgi:PAS domain S-box-containing protein
MPISSNRSQPGLSRQEAGKQSRASRSAANPGILVEQPDQVGQLRQRQATMAARLSIFHKGLILILSPILLETVVVFGLYSVLTQTDRQQAVEASYKERSASVIKLSSLTFQTCMLLFAMGVPGSALPRDYFDEKIVELRQQADQAENLMRSDSYLRPIFSELHKSQYKTIKLLEDLGETIIKGSGTTLISQLDETISQIGRILTGSAGYVDKFISYNDRRINDSAAMIQTLRATHFRILLAAIAGNIVLSVFLLGYFQTAIIKRLARIRANTELLKNNEDLGEPLAGSDEIALLDQSFHAMQQALKETRRRETLFFDNAADVICILNQDNQFKRLNQASLHNWGLTPEALEGRSIESIIWQEDRQSTLDQLNLCRAENREVSFENRVLRNQITAVAYHWSVYFEPVEKQLYCLAHDISAEKELEKARERYFAIVSRDLKQPVASISASFAAVSEIAGLPEKAAAKVDLTSGNLQRLLALVDELSKRRSFAGSDRELKIASTKLADLLEQAAAEVEGLARAKRIRIVCGATAIEIPADRNRLMQVLVNLLSNAVKFSKEQGEVILSADDAGESVRISVQDKGRGIPENQLGTIFEKYRQVSEADGRRAFGTGLGLPICKQIIEQHGGSITVASSHGQGSTFSISLPKAATGATLPVDDRQKEPGLDSTARQTSGAKTEISDRKPGGKLQNLPVLIKGAVLVGVPLIFEVVLVGALTFFFLQSESLAKGELQERQIANLANDITFCYRKMAVSLLGSAQEGQPDSFHKNKKATTEIARRLRALVRNDPQRSQRLDKIIKQIKSCNAQLERSYDRKFNSSEEAPRYFSIGITLRLLKPLSTLTQQLQELVQESSRRESLSPQRQKHLRETQIALLGAGLLANMALGLALARLFSNDISRRLQRVARNTGRLAREEYLEAPLAGSDEIAVLDQVFHRAAAELSAARKRERTIFDNSKEVICSFSEDGKMTSVNPAASKLWGYARSDLLSRDFLSIVHPDDRENTRTNLFAGAALPAPLSFENRVLRADGTNSDLLWSATRATQAKEIFCVAHDLSEKKEAVRLRNEFLSIVSHDLRTPLSGILVTVAMLEEGGFGTIPEEAVQKLATVTSDVNRLLELINDLLDIEKLEAGMMAFSLARIGLKELAEEIIEKNKLLLTEKRITINVRTGETALNVDKHRFGQALANLLANAVERSPVGAGIDILACQDSKFCSLIIRDHSAPMDSQSSQSIFDRFALTTSDSSSNVSRLSLPLSQSIIKLHGGTVELSGQQECGNDFVVKMPLQNTAASHAFEIPGK